MDKEQQSRLKMLIEKGKEQGFLTYAEVNDHLPEDIVDPQQIEDIIGMINDMGILVHEVAPDTDSLLLASAKNSARALGVLRSSSSAATSASGTSAAARASLETSMPRTAP